MFKLNQFTAAGALLALAACDPSAPSHFPNPVQLPGAIIGTTVDNSFYNARRKRVAAFVRANYPAMVAEIQAGTTTLAYAAMDIARVPAPSQPVLFKEFQDNPAIYLSGDPEKMIVALMVWGN